MTITPEQTQFVVDFVSRSLLGALEKKYDVEVTMERGVVDTSGPTDSLFNYEPSGELHIDIKITNYYQGRTLTG